MSLNSPLWQNRLRLFAARLGLCALLLQALFPSLIAAGQANAAADMWDRVVLCTADGPKTVSLAELGSTEQDGRQPPGQNAPHAPYCPACPGYFQANAAITPAILIAAKPVFNEIGRLLPDEEPALDGRRFVPQSARAPPFFA